ncbi:MAG: MBL fold metallo-hydrolase [Phycisphaeraceae bacterium]|nr:MBL fold metallo-hydrolase [Phycisphaeraceae bacterium]
MKLTFLGANRQVTGSSYLLEAGGLRLMIDRGLFQEYQFRERNWSKPTFDPASIDALLLTHAHLDHCGLLPRLVAQGFKGPIHCTEPTVELAKIVMEDSARIQQEDVAFKRKRHIKEGRSSPHPYAPLYTIEDARKVGPLMRGVRYDQPVALNHAVTVRFHDAGHILGSAMLLIEVRENGSTRRLVFSGDLGQPNVPIVDDPTIIEAADVVVMESTYGDRDHDRHETILDQLAEVINRAAERHGLVLIPTFAIERAQEVLLHLALLLNAGRIPRMATFLDSPMAVNVTEVFRRHHDYMDQPTRELLNSDKLDEAWKQLHMLRSSEESKQLNDRKGPGIIMAGSGMCTGGRIKHHLANHMGTPQNIILFVGYQAVGTLGRQILDGKTKVRLFGVPRDVLAEVQRVEGLSAHAGRSDLLGWLRHYRKPPKQLFLTHGDERVSEVLAEQVRSRMGWNVSVPAYGDTVRL